jgi:carbamate kinase
MHPDAAPLDVLGAETEGMIGYLIEQALAGALPAHRRIAVLLTQVEVDPADPAFARPVKPIGPVYPADTAARLAAARGWRFAADGGGMRRVVASPAPRAILERDVIALLVDSGVVVVCAGGGGIPVARRPDGALVGIEAVVDKDRASALLAREIGADALLLLTDVDGVHADFGTPTARRLSRLTVSQARKLDLPDGSMGPKVEAACAFVAATGGIAAIGRLADASDLRAGRRGTVIVADEAD